MVMVVRLPFCLRVPVEPEVGVMAMRVSVVVIVPMRCRCIGGLLEPALFADFFGLRNGVVKRVALADGVRGKTLNRIFIHVAGQRDLRVLHAQGAWITRILARGGHRIIGFSAHAVRNGKRGDYPGSFSAAVGTGFLRFCLTQGTQFLKDDGTGRAVVFVKWHADISSLPHGFTQWRLARGATHPQSSGSCEIQTVHSCRSQNGPQALDGQR